MKAIINSHNQKILQNKPEAVREDRCNCQRHRKDKCPLKGSCVQEDAIYHATVRNGEEEERKYVGSTVNFKRRFYSHTASFKKESKKHSTALSTHVWDKELGPEPDIEWSILAHAPAYSKGQRTCDLCLTEKLHIANNYNDRQYLNRRGEMAQKCRHKSRFLLQPPKKGAGRTSRYCTGGRGPTAG